MQLFTICVACHCTSARAIIKSVIGTMITVVQTCKTCGNEWKWESQPYVCGMPAGNILLSASILFAGAIPGKTLRVLRLMGVIGIHPNTYFRHQDKYLHKTIRQVWEKCTTSLINQLRGTELVLGGDGRSDSMGHCAKYGTYSLLELNANKIVCINTVQVNRVHYSFKIFR